MPSKATVDSFFGFIDKYLVQIVLAVVALIVYKTIQKSLPTDEEKDEQVEETKRQDVNERLVPPPAPPKDKDGNIPKAQEVAYNAKIKAHRSATYANQLYDFMHTGRVPNFAGVNKAEILATAYNVALARITLKQLEADYLAQQEPSMIFVRSKLVDDLKFSLGPADYLIFMQRIGLSVEKAYALTQPKKK